MTIKIKSHYAPRFGQDIKEVEFRENNVLIETAHGDLWRVSIEFDGQPVIELIERDRRTEVL